MINIVIISTNNAVFYGLVTKDNLNNILYDALASDNIYTNERKYINSNMDTITINNLIMKFKKTVYFTTKIRCNLKKLKNISISKKKLFILDTL